MKTWLRSLGSIALAGTLLLSTGCADNTPKKYTVVFKQEGYTDMIFEEAKHHEIEWSPRKLWGNAEEYEAEYIHPLWRDYDASGGHGGMDFLVFSAFVEYARLKKEPPIDAYDAAVYMAVTALSEESIAKGSAPVYMPDFTTGKWCERKKLEDTSKYAL